MEGNVKIPKLGERFLFSDGLNPTFTVDHSLLRLYRNGVFLYSSLPLVVFFKAQFLAHYFFYMNPPWSHLLTLAV